MSKRRVRRNGLDLGEYWLEDVGMAVYADGDIGDTNHEMEAFQGFLGLDLDFIRTDCEISPNGFDWACLAQELVDEAEIEADVGDLDKMSKQNWTALAEKLEVDDRYLSSKADRDVILGLTWLQKHDASMEFVEWWISQKGMADAREYALEHGGWIRVKGVNFETWNFDEHALHVIREADFWPEEDEEGVPLEESEEEIYVDELSTGQGYTLKLKELFNYSLHLPELRALGRGEEWARPAPEAIKVWPKHTTDTAGKEQWLYRRIGENPKRKKRCRR